ncbi:MAG: regulatory protein RecX, partial [Dyella sp.]
KALGLLARREHSRREQGRKLEQGGYERDEAGAALERLGEQSYQDDARFGQVLVRSRASHGYGPQRIRAELKSHGLADAAIRQLLQEAEQDWDQLAANQLRRRYGTTAPGDAAERAKRAQFLLRRGFDGASVRAALAVEIELDEFDGED